MLSTLNMATAVGHNAARLTQIPLQISFANSGVMSLSGFQGVAGGRMRMMSVIMIDDDDNDEDGPR